jgi:hypothetical protein
MLSHLLNLLALLERTIYLQNTPNDKGNGFRTRNETLDISSSSCINFS